MDIEAAFDELYSVPLADFIGERDRLASELKAAGDGDASKRLKSSRKPTVDAWATNQLTRVAREKLDRLLQLRDDLRTAGSADRMRELVGERRKVVTDLLKDATRVLADGGHPASTQTLDKISMTLEAVTTQDDVSAVASGRLSSGLMPGGFDALLPEGGTLEDDATELGPSASDRRAVRKLADAAAAAAARADRLTQDAEDAAKRATLAADEAGRARRVAEDALAEARRAADEAGINLDDV